MPVYIYGHLTWYTLLSPILPRTQRTLLVVTASVCSRDFPSRDFPGNLQFEIPVSREKKIRDPGKNCLLNRSLYLGEKQQYFALFLPLRKKSSKKGNTLFDPMRRRVLYGSYWLGKKLSHYKSRLIMQKSSLNPGDLLSKFFPENFPGSREIDFKFPVSREKKIVREIPGTTAQQGGR